MPSKKLAQEQFNKLLPVIQIAADEHYTGDIAKGFRHWAFSLVLGAGNNIEDTDILDHTAIDGSDDFEIDGWLMQDEDDGPGVTLFQSKYREPGTSMGPKELAVFLNAPDRILSPDQVVNANNEETKELHDRIVKLTKASNQRCTINLVWVTSGTLSPKARLVANENAHKTISREVAGSPREFAITMKSLDVNDLFGIYKMQLDTDDPDKKPCDVEFQLEQNWYHEVVVPSITYRTLNMTIPVGLIIDAFEEHQYKLFNLNPRGPLGNKINQGMKRTLANDERKNRFHLLNNGITAICNQWVLDTATQKLSVKDFQIVNGCQTTVTLWDVRASIKHDQNVRVSVKLSECPEDIAKDIATTTNTQATIRAEDRISNDIVQKQLQIEFASIDPPWFYQVRRGEWTRMLGTKSDKQKYFDEIGKTYRRLTTKEVAQSVLAFAGLPGDAKDKIRYFLNKQALTHPANSDEISYEQIYTSDLSADQLLLPASIQRRVWANVAKEKDQEPWLEYARFHILALVGGILRKRYAVQSHLFPASRAKELTAKVEAWLPILYKTAVIAIRNARKEAEDSGTYAGHREYFRSTANYGQMQTRLKGALELARDYDDPMTILPA